MPLTTAQSLGWNLARLAETLVPLLDPSQEKAIEIANDRLSGIAPRYRADWLAVMRRKLGLLGEDPGDASLADDLLPAMQGADWTLTFRRLADVTALRPLFPDFTAMEAWLPRWRARAGDGAAERLSQANPAVIPRNHKVEDALTAATSGDMAPFQALLSAIRAPFTETDLMNGLETVNTVVGSTSTPDTIIGSPFMMRAISSWYNETRRSGMGDSKASVKWTEIETWSGTVKLVSHYLFAKLPGMNGRIYAMDPSKIKRRPYASDTGWNTGQYETQGWHTRGYLRGDFTSLWPEADTRIEWRNASTTSSDYAGFS